MTGLNTIKNWFKTGLKPTQTQFWDTWDSFWHKEDRIPVTQIDGVDNLLDQKANKSIVDNHLTDSGAHSSLFLSKEDISKKGQPNGYAPLNATKKIPSENLEIINNLIDGGETSLLSAEMGKLLRSQILNIQNLLHSNDVTLDSVQELVDAIKNVEFALTTILVNDLTSGGITKALTAEMGKYLQDTKVNKVNGKGLSSEDFTSELKTKLSSIGVASSTSDGLLTIVDWNKFNNKQAALGFTPYNSTNPSGFISGITLSMVIAALGYTPYNASNPAGFVTSNGSVNYANSAGSVLWSNVSNKPTALSQFSNDLGNYGGWITGINSAMIIAALGFTPYNSTNPASYISGINLAMVVAALGYTPYNSSNPAGYVTASGSVNYASSAGSAGSVAWGNVSGRPTALSQFSNDLGNYGGWITGINSGMVNSALGYTPYNSSNPAGYITRTSLSSYLPLSGGTLSGNLTVYGNLATSGETYTGTYFKAGAGANEPYLWNPYGGDHWRATASAWYTYIGVGSTNFFSTSLRSSKTNIVPFTRSALDIINSVDVVEFNYKTDLENKRIGFIADDTVQELSTKNHNQMDINSSIGVLMKAIQEQQLIIDSLNDKINSLELLVNQL
jgi:hypothetical protein